MAAAIAFYALFSLLPIMFLLFSFIGSILGTETWLLERIIEFVRQSLPYLSDGIVEDIKGLINNREFFGWLGMITLIWSAEFVILGVKDAMNRIFGPASKTSFIKTRLIVWGIFFLWSGVVVISIGITAAAEIISKIKITPLGVDIPYYLAKSITFQYFLPFIIMTAATAIVFKMMAGGSIRIEDAIFGSIIFSILWEGAKHLFAFYISHFRSFNKTYGSLGALMIMLLWIFYSANIFLFSAELIESVRAERKKAR